MPKRAEPTAAWPVLMSVEIVARYTDISVRTIWRLVSSSKFPKPIPVNAGGRLSRWRRADIDTWTEELGDRQ